MNGSCIEAPSPPLSSSSAEQHLKFLQDFEFIRDGTNDERTGTVHVKGFGQRVQWDDRTLRLKAAFLEQVIAMAPRRIVFDGDNLAPDSFTSLIPDVYKGLAGAVEIAAFTVSSRLNSFARSWSAAGLPICVYLCPPVTSWADLGAHAMKITGATRVVCFGGGPVVRNELQRLVVASSSPVDVVVFPVERLAGDGSDQTETCSLLHVVHSNNNGDGAAAAMHIIPHVVCVPGVVVMDGETSLMSKIVYYRSKGVGCDMAVKTVMWLLRLRHLYTPIAHAEERQRLATLISSLLDGRMLYNQWKFLGSAVSLVHAVKALRNPPLHHDAPPRAALLLDVLCFIFRTAEQIIGDLNYWQKNVRRDWSRQRLSWNWKFCKTMGLVCYTIVELYRMMLLRREMMAAASSRVLLSDVQQRKHLEEQRAKLTDLAFIILRNLCDISIYFQWVEWYRPWPTLQCLCGISSGLIGVRSVWHDVERHSAI